MLSKVQTAVARGRAFLSDVQTELKKCSWPTRSELMESTLVVIISVVLLALFVGISDAVVLALLRWVLR